ncbi:MAG: response regulator [Deltaproteobacteria bacterium]|nr:response regulator [Deltaproteobacteria bacterium]
MVTELEDARKEAEYYRKIAKNTGDQFLRETEELSTLVNRIRGVEKALREGEERLRNIIEHSNEMFYLCDINQKFIYVSPKSQEFLGFKPDDMKSTWTDLITDNPDNRAGLESTVKAIESAIKQKPYMIECRKKDGNKILLEIDESPVLDEQGRVVAIAGAARDVTGREKLEADLRQAIKMEAIGTLAGGIAHDFNNLLMGIQGRASLMLMDIDRFHPFYDHLKGIEEHIQSASDLTKQLLAFARKGKFEVKPVDMNGLIRHASQMFGRTKKDIKINLLLQQDLWTVETDRSQMEQVFLNLLINAWHAMPNGGEIFIRSENRMLDIDFTHSFSALPGNYVKISVSDTGMGIDENIREKIFDPFFTTKEMGRGTGLGLASVYGIIKNHSGIIDVQSKRGEGTTFDIYLPGSNKEAPEVKRIDEKALQGAGTILLVDDEPMIINVGKALLERLGYRVIIAENGMAAIELYEEEKDRIDIVILDIIMPGMNGIETYKRLKKCNPEIKVLFSSGYSMDESSPEIMKLDTNGFIQKPYKFEKLSQKLRTMMGTN